MAVLFADVTNSAALYHKLGDARAREVIALALAAFENLLPAHEGRLVKTLGDAVMCVFPRAECGLDAACAMQLTARSTPFEGERLQLHIGLHFGPVLLEGDDVYGDTVNAAAYLAAAATVDQILTTETVCARLPPALRASVRPIFNAMLKGSATESMVYQALWRAEDMEVTTVNAHAGRLVPGDPGGLRVSYGSVRLQVDQQHPTLTVGRSNDCDIVAGSMFASRRHATIQLRRTRFYLIDHSTNGTYVWMRGEEAHVLRSEMLLDEAGEISLGRRRGERADELLRFERDRRSMYRV